MKTAVAGALLGVVLAIGIGFLVTASFRDGAEAAKEAANAVAEDVGGKVGEQVGAGIQDGIRQGVKDGLDEVEKNTIEAPGQVLEEIAGIITQGKGGDVLGSITDRLKKPEINSPSEAVSAVFGLGREAMKTADDLAQQTLGISDQQEIEIGQKLQPLILKDKKPLHDPDRLARVRQVAAPLVERRSRQGIPITFNLLDDPEINAMAMPGGFIYVHRGLLDFVKTDAELQFVLGHEIGHVDKKHCIRNFTYSLHAAQVAGGLGQAVMENIYRQYELGFTEELELEADKYAYFKMKDIGRSKEEILSFTKRFLEHLKAKGLAVKAPHSASLPETVGNEIHNHFRTHPPTQERLEKLESLDP